MAGLTKQHFIEIANKINRFIVHFSETQGLTDSINDEFNLFVLDMSNYLKTQNPLFNENQFKKACLE